MRCPRGRICSALADPRDDDRESTDEERRPDHEVRQSGRPNQERSSEHVPHQPHAREITLPPELGLEVQKLIAIPIANPPRIQSEQRARQAGAHAPWTPTRARPTRAIIASRLS